MLARSKDICAAAWRPSPTLTCPWPCHSVDLDFLVEETLDTELVKAPSRFDAKAPTLFVCEGLIMYLGAAGKLKLIKDVSAVAAPGSVFLLQFVDATGSKAAQENPSALEHALSVEDATRALTEHGWANLEFARFGDDKLNFGRFPTDKFAPSAAFSFCVSVHALSECVVGKCGSMCGSHGSGACIVM